MKNHFKALSLFSGCGGFCEGIHAAGFDIATAVEWDKFACETYRYNFPSIPLFEGDIHNFMKKKEEMTRFDGLDLLFGGPPCQGFSQIGTRRLDDERNDLYKEYTRIVRQTKPRIFLMENVPNLTLMSKGHFKELILQEFESLGYKNTIVLRVSADDYGVPQTRQRIIFVGTRDIDRFPYNLENFCAKTLGDLQVKKSVTVSEAISDLPEAVVESGGLMAYKKTTKPSQFMREMRLDYDGKIYSKTMKRERGLGKENPVLHNQHTKDIQERRAKLISLLKPGMKADSLPKEFWNGKRPEKWRRLHPDFPSYTILAHMHRDLSEWVHPKLDRWITVREAARLQSFHDGFIFRGSEWQQLKQIGNAVPPLLGRALGLLAAEILKVLDLSSISPSVSVSVKRGSQSGD